MATTTTIQATALSELISRGCQGVGLSRADSEAVAEVLVYANLRGQDAHGLVRLANYMRRVKGGLAGGSDRIRTVAGSGPLRRLDAGRAIGPAAATRASDLAAEIAREHGVAVVGLGNATHFGSAGFYVRRIAGLGLVGIAISNGPKAIAPYGAAEALLGTNPLAVGIPIGNDKQMVLDMATGAIPRGQVRRAAKSGAPLPPGAALDSAGRPTVDAKAALDGSILPIAGSKGSGLALTISMLAIMLAGAEADDELGMPAGSAQGDAGRFPLFSGSVGQLFLAIDPEPLLGASSPERLEGLVERLHGLRPADGFDSPRLPGETGDLMADNRLKHGVPVQSEHLSELAETCREFGLDELAGRLEADYLRG